ncbi:MAG: hypothetical protein E6G51_01185 [Actinobacteria bacterium]|nr:MAG: hypothetical protein E6G51_01185 [Actinomycetota bacterium]
MFKKLIVACMAVAAFAAFVLPAAASATSPVLKTTNGEISAVGTKITAKNTGSTIFSGSFGEVVCSSADLKGVVTKNSNNGEAVEGTIESASFTGTSGTGTQCSSSLGATTVTTAPTGSSNGTPWCVKALPGVAHELQIRGGSCSSAARAITYRLDFPGGLECSYERTTLTGPVKGTYTTSPEIAMGTISTGANSTFKIESGQSFLCPSEGSLTMTFDLYMEGGEHLVVG